MQMSNREIIFRYNCMMETNQDRVKILSELNDCDRETINMIIQSEELYYPRTNYNVYNRVVTLLKLKEKHHGKD